MISPKRLTRIPDKLARQWGYRVLREDTRGSQWGFIKRVLDEHSVNLVLDVGANIGGFARSVRKLGYDGDIVSFEPVKATFRKLKNSLDGDPHWSGYNVGLGSENTQVLIHVEPEYSDFASIRNKAPEVPRTVSAWGDAETEMESVTIRRLDSFDLTGTGSVTYLKTDTQGYDLEVLKGAGSIMDSVVALQVEAAVAPIYEHSPKIPETVVTLESLGFSPVAFFPVTTSGMSHSIPVIEFDIVACRTEFIE